MGCEDQFTVRSAQTHACCAFCPFRLCSPSVFHTCAGCPVSAMLSVCPMRMVQGYSADMALVKKKRSFANKPPSSSRLVRAVQLVLEQALKQHDGMTARIHHLLDSEIGRPVFCVQGDSSLAPWQPPKPGLSRLVLEALVSPTPLPDGKPVALALTVIGVATLNLRLFKIVARRAIESVIANRRESLQTGGELKAELFQDDAKLYASISRIGADVLGVIARRAAAAIQGRTDVVVDLHDWNKQLCGRETRGFGLVVCGNGLQLVRQIGRELLLTE